MSTPTSQSEWTSPSVMNSILLYWALISQSLRSQLQYRASFLLMTLGSFVVGSVEAFGVWALFDRFGTLDIWTLPQVAFLYGLINCVFAFSEAFARGFDIFGNQFVKTGDFDRVLLRPRTATLQIIGFEFQLYRVGRFVQGAVIFAWAVWMLDIDWTLAKVGLVFFTALGGVLFFAGLFILQATVAFWTIESLEIMNTLTYGGRETAQYPLPIYSNAFRRFFTYIVPLGCVSYFPAVALFGIEDPLGSPLWVQICAPGAGALFFALSILAWRIGIRHYTSTGS